jgi:CRP-like cAMP-binding protein
VHALLSACDGLPTLHLAAGAPLLGEGQPRTALYVLASGSVDISVSGARVATVSEPGSVIGEFAFLLDIDHGATVTAASPTRVHVVDDVNLFLTEDTDRLLEITRTLALLLHRLSAYLSDVRAQYSDAGGHLELLDEVLAELTFGVEPPATAGSARDPEPLY